MRGVIVDNQGEEPELEVSPPSWYDSWLLLSLNSCYPYYHPHPQWNRAEKTGGPAGEDKERFEVRSFERFKSQTTTNI